MSSGDYPKLSRRCFKSFPHSSKSCQVQDTPILHFGSVFRRQESLPNMIAMPMPAHHLPCFRSWSTRGSICGSWQSKNPDSGRGNLVFGEEYGLTYQDLIPQLSGGAMTSVSRYIGRSYIGWCALLPQYDLILHTHCFSLTAIKYNQDTLGILIIIVFIDLIPNKTSKIRLALNY